MLSWRRVAAIDWVREELLLVVGPELAYVRIRLDHGVDELPRLTLAPADEDIADDVSVLVELDRTTRGIGQRHLVQGLGERLPVVGLAVEHLNGGLDAHAGDIHAGRIATGEREVGFLHRLDKALVAW